MQARVTAASADGVLIPRGHGSAADRGSAAHSRELGDRPVVMKVERPEEAKYCSSCGARLGSEARFCAGCGASVAPPAAPEMSRTCPRCKGPLADGWFRKEDGRYDCFRCGRPVDPVYHQPPPTLGWGAPAAQAGVAWSDQQRIRPAREVSGALAFLCWFLLGGVGMHRFYLGQNTYGVVMLCVNIGLTLLTLGAWLIGVLIWWLIELLLLPGAIRAAREGR